VPLLLNKCKKKLDKFTKDVKIPAFIQGACVNTGPTGMVCFRKIFNDPKS
jgi:hypothetical protein